MAFGKKKKITRETIAARFPKQQKKKKPLAMLQDQENGAAVDKTPKQTRKQIKKGTPNSRPKWTPRQNEKSNDDDDDDDDDDESEDDDVIPASSAFSKQEVEDNEEEDDEEEEDDDDVEEDDDDTEKEEDDDDDEQEEDDEDDSDDAENKVVFPPPPKKAKKVETPVTEKASPVKKEKKESVAKQVDPNDNPDVRTLFVKHIPGDATVPDIKALSSDIQEVRLRKQNRHWNKKKENQLAYAYAYLEFENEATADKNHAKLQGAEMKGAKLVVDYVGAKSKNAPVKQRTQVDDFDPLKLYLAGIPNGVQDEDIKEIFPHGTNIVIPRAKKSKRIFGYGFVQFPSAKLAKQAHDKGQGQGVTLKGSQLVVLFARKSKSPKEDVKKEAGVAKKAQQKSEDGNDDKQPAAKKIKKFVEEMRKETDKKGEDDDEEEDDDDDDDDNYDDKGEEDMSADDDGEGDDDDDDGEDDDDDDEDDDEEDDD